MYDKIHHKLKKKKKVLSVAIQNWEALYKNYLFPVAVRTRILAWDSPQGRKWQSQLPKELVCVENWGSTRTTYLYPLKHAPIYLPTHSHCPKHCMTLKTGAQKLQSPFLIHRPLDPPKSPLHPLNECHSQAKATLEVSLTVVHFLFQFPYLKSHCSIHHL